MYWNVPRIVPCAGQARRRRRQRRHARADDAGAPLRQPEVEQLGAALRQHDVAGLQIPVDDACAVRLVERVGNLRSQSSAPRSSGSAPRSSRSASVSPSRYSMTRNAVPSWWPTS